MRALKILLVLLLVAAAPVGVYLAPRAEHGPSHPDRWDSRVQDLVGFVERERGLRFLHPVTVRFLDDASFDAEVAATAGEKAAAREEAERYVAAFRALGLLGGAPDLLDALDRLGQASILGLYDHESEELSLQGTTLTPGVKATLVHELTHALQDQHFDLGAVLDSAPHGAEAAVHALVEGDAERIENTYVAGLSEAERAAYEDDQQPQETGDVPAVLQHAMAFPYVFGPVFLDVLVGQGGNATVDAAFRHPPVSDAHVLDPRTHPLSWRPAAVEDPELPEGATPVDEPGAFGQFSLYEVLGSKLGHAPAWAAVTGWTGDRYQLYTHEERTCVAFTVKMAEPSSATRLETALQSWSTSTEAAVRRNGREVDVRACDPGSAAAPPAHQPAAFDVLALRATLLHLGMGQGIAFSRATCVVDHVLAELGERGVVLLMQGRLSAAQSALVQRVFATAQARCPG